MAQIEIFNRQNVEASRYEIEEITPEVVKAAAVRMKPGKHDVNQSYTSAHSCSI